MRISDWSSDVCSSDLRRPVPNARPWLFSRDESGWWRIDRDAVGLEILVGVELEVDARDVLVIERVRIAIMGDLAPIFAAEFGNLAHPGLAADGDIAVSALAVIDMRAMEVRQTPRLNSSHYCDTRMPPSAR